MQERTRIRYKNFLNEYLKNGNNATQAYLSISPKVAVTTAAEEGKKYLRKPYVTRLLEQHKKKMAKKGEVTLESQMKEAERLKKMAEENGDMKSVIDLFKEQNKLVGLYAPKKTENLNKNISVEDVLKELQIKEKDVL